MSGFLLAYGHTIRFARGTSLEAAMSDAYGVIDHERITAVKSALPRNMPD